MLERLMSYRGVRAVLKKAATNIDTAPVLPMHFRKGTTLGTPQDVMAQELRIESFFR